MNSDSSSNCNPTPNDILLGRGRSYSHNLGNIHYQALVRKYHHAYFSSQSQREKNLLSSTIVREIQQNCGRFLKKDKDGWKLVPDEAARIKVAHTLQYYERLRKRDDPNQQLSVTWNSKGKSQTSDLRTKGPDAVLTTQAGAATSTQRIRNYPVFMNQQAHAATQARNEQRQPIQLEYEFLGESSLAHARTSGICNPSHVSKATIFYSADNSEPENMQEENMDRNVCVKDANEPTEVCVPFSSTNGIYQKLQANQTEYMSAAQQRSDEVAMKSKLSPITLQVFLGIQSQAKADSSQEAPVLSDIGATNDSSHKRNDQCSDNNIGFHENSQQQGSELVKSKPNVDSLRVDSLAGSIVRSPSNRASATCTYKEMLPERYESSNSISTNETTSECEDVYDYEYENPLLSEKQEKPTAKAVAEYFAAKQRINVAHEGHSSPKEPLPDQRDKGDLSYSSALLMSMTERKGQSPFSGALSETPSNDKKFGKVGYDSCPFLGRQPVVRNRNYSSIEQFQK